MAGAKEGKSQGAFIRFNTKGENLSRFLRVFIGIVVNQGYSYNVQTHFDREGYFAIKATPLVDNFCLLEEMQEGEIADMIREGNN